MEGNSTPYGKSISKCSEAKVSTKYLRNGEELDLAEVRLRGEGAGSS